MKPANTKAAIVAGKEVALSCSDELARDARMSPTYNTATKPAFIKNAVNPNTEPPTIIIRKTGYHGELPPPVK